MVNSKAAVLLIIASLLVAVGAGIAVAQFAGAQTYASRGTVAQSPDQGYSSYGGSQFGSYGGGHGMGMGMCGRFR
jgi:hypothetical protein